MMRVKILYKFSFLFILLSIILLGIGYSGTSKEITLLSFTKKDSNRIVVRWSDDGLNWQDGTFPTNVTSTILHHFGTGCGADTNGVVTSVMFSELSRVNVVLGIGSASWDTTATHASVHSPPYAWAPASAPSLVNLGPECWAVGYRSVDNRLIILIYSTNNKSFLMANNAPADSRLLHTNVAGRPAITRMGDKVLIAWRRFDGGIYQLWTAVGNATSSGIHYPSGSLWQEFALPTDSEFGAGLSGDPDVTHDGNQFYIAFPREERGGGPGTLHGWRLVVYNSVDGVTWNKHSQFWLEGLVSESLINIAGRSGGELLAAAVRTSGNVGKVGVARYDGNRWSTVSPQTIFGTNRVEPKQFALISYKVFEPSNGGCSCRRM